MKRGRSNDQEATVVAEAQATSDNCDELADKAAHEPETSDINTRGDNPSDNPQLAVDTEDISSGPSKRLQITAGASPRSSPRAQLSTGRPVQQSEEGINRNKRMFGNLMSHLGSAKRKLEQDSHKIEQQDSVKREAVSKHVEEGHKLLEAAKLLTSLEKEKKMLERELSISKQKLKLFPENSEVWENILSSTENFIMTNTTPQIAWLPSRASQITNALLEERKEEVKKKREERKVSDAEELANIEKAIETTSNRIKEVQEQIAAHEKAGTPSDNTRSIDASETVVNHPRADLVPWTASSPKKSLNDRWAARLGYGSRENPTRDRVREQDPRGSRDGRGHVQQRGERERGRGEPSQGRKAVGEDSYDNNTRDRPSARSAGRRTEVEVKIGREGYGNITDNSDSRKKSTARQEESTSASGSDSESDASSGNEIENAEGDGDQLLALMTGKA